MYARSMATMAAVLVMVAQAPMRVGTVHFANSCKAPAQPEFGQGMAMLHSFEFGTARRAFESALSVDPQCAIAFWAIGLTEWGNPFAAAARSADALQRGKTAIDRARAIAGGTPRERGFIDAAAKLYDRAETLDQRTRMIAYRNAMAQLAGTYRSDPEASIFYALSLAAAADPTDKTYADQLKAGAILERLWTTEPDHPGIAHYIIHTYDAPPLAGRALAAARRYAAIAPDVPHALHMPAHTFTRLGYWQESIDTNIRSATAAHAVGNIAEELHASDYEMYAYLQTAQDAAAKRIVESVAAIASRFDPRAATGAAPPSAGYFAIAAIPARYSLERGAWADAARLEERRSPIPYADAITYFARAVGAARSKDPALVAGAQHDVDHLQALADGLEKADEGYWTEIVTIQRLGASAWLAHANGRDAEALRLMREAAEREDRTEKNVVTPGPLAPAREMLGELLLELKQPKDAIAEFRTTMRKEPNRYRAIAGAMHASSALGDADGARSYAGQLAAICVRGDRGGRPELEAARRIKQ